jgi:hypothetical protein
MGDVGEDRGNNTGRTVERVTIAKAAALLGCHPNTVRNRVKAGMYRAEKFHTENGPTWMIERDSLTNNAPTSARQQGVSGVPAAQQEAIQELAKAIVREAGIAREDVVRLENREDVVRLENNLKAYAEFFRSLAFLNTALLAGIAATVAFLPTLHQGIFWLLVSMGAVVVGTLLALLGLVVATAQLGVVGTSRPILYRLSRRLLDPAGVLAALAFVIAMLAFSWFALTSLLHPL